jgi:hypothetical protein
VAEVVSASYGRCTYVVGAFVPQSRDYARDKLLKVKKAHSRSLRLISTTLQNSSLDADTAILKRKGLND